MPYAVCTNHVLQIQQHSSVVCQVLCRVRAVDVAYLSRWYTVHTTHSSTTQAYNKVVFPNEPLAVLCSAVPAAEDFLVPERDHEAITAAVAAAVTARTDITGPSASLNCDM